MKTILALSSLALGVNAIILEESSYLTQTLIGMNIPHQSLADTIKSSGTLTLHPCIPDIYDFGLAFPVFATCRFTHLLSTSSE
jgi:hypothetical protein